MIPLVVVVFGEKIDNSHGVSLFQLLKEMLAMQSHLVFRLPQLRQPQSQEKRDGQSAEKAGPGTNFHG